MENFTQLLTMTLTDSEKIAVTKLVQTQVQSLDYNEYAKEEDYTFWNNLLHKLSQSL